MKMGGANSRAGGGPCWQQCCWMRQGARVPSDVVLSAGKGVPLILVVQHLERKPRRRKPSLIGVDTNIYGTAKVACSVDPQVVSHKISMRCWSHAMAAARNSRTPRCRKKRLTARLARRTAARRVRGKWLLCTIAGTLVRNRARSA
jgi:hypothetical protein